MRYYFCAFFILCLNSFFLSKEFQGSLLFSCIVQFSRCCFKASSRLLYYITSFRFCQVLFSSFFKNFFSVILAFPLSSSASGQLVYYTTFSRVCQALFQNFFQNFFLGIFPSATVGLIFPQARTNLLPIPLFSRLSLPTALSLYHLF